MREIKFRAWDTDGNKMIYSSDIWWDFKLNLEMYGSATTKENELEHHYIISRFKLMQFTGFKDKNGKEIYEGDIVEYFDEGNAEIVFEEGMFKFKYLIKPRNSYAIYSSLMILKVIGNIYENPELLKCQEQTKGVKHDNIKNK